MTAWRSGYPGVMDGEPSPGDVTHPSDVTPTRGLFDRLAERVTRLVSGGPFSFICAAVVGGWIVLGAAVRWTNRWAELGALIMATIAFLLVAVVENAQRRSDQATQHKLNAIADALGEFMAAEKVDEEQVAELRAAVGLEKRESTSAA